jgi:hypothetical protein
MMKRSKFIAGALALSFSILQSGSLAMAHGHGGGVHFGNDGGHHRDARGHNDDDGGYYGDGGNGHYHETNNGGEHRHYDSDEFWDGAAVGGVVGYGTGNGTGNGLNSDPCAELTYRREHADQCSN